MWRACCSSADLHVVTQSSLSENYSPGECTSESTIKCEVEEFTVNKSTACNETSAPHSADSSHQLIDSTELKEDLKQEISQETNVNQFDHSNDEVSEAEVDSDNLSTQCCLRTELKKDLKQEISQETNVHQFDRSSVEISEAEVDSNSLSTQCCLRTELKKDPKQETSEETNVHQFDHSGDEISEAEVDSDSSSKQCSGKRETDPEVKVEQHEGPDMKVSDVTSTIQASDDTTESNKCPICNKIFSCFRYLKRHIQRQHERREDPTQCKKSSDDRVIDGNSDAVDTDDAVDSDHVPVKKSKLENDFLKYYEKLKTCIKDEREINYTPLTIVDFSGDKAQLLEEVMAIVKTLDRAWHNRWKHYCECGYALAKLKVVYLTRCHFCMDKQRDMFASLSCRRCARASSGNSFFTDVEKVLPFKRDYINFLINIAGLTAKYPKLLQTPFSSYKLKQFMKYLPEQLEKDKCFWVK